MADPKKTSAGNRANVVSMDRAAREIERQKKMRRDTPPMEPRGPNKVLAGQWTPDLYGMPSDPECESPVMPIGFEGAYKYVIDSMGQFRVMKAADFNQVGIQDLYSDTPNYPKWMCPRWSKPVVDKKGVVTKPAEIVSFEADDIKEILFQACARMGFFSPNDKMRGRGAWTLRSGALVYHAGNAIWQCRRGKFSTLPTGMIEQHLYPRLSALPEPWTQPIGLEDNPAGKLLATFRKWHWTRPEVDPVLLLGWIGVAFLGGALDWRSACLLLGDRATGKSTLQAALRDIFGEALFRSADTTAAGIYQAMAHDARPVALDELEPDADSRKLDNVVHLMRTSSSGDIGRRGGPTKGEASEFQMRSAFLFSAINNPLRSAQDMSRVAVLRLLPLDLNQERPAPVNADTAGPMILALMMQGWGEAGEGFRAEKQRFSRALAEGGHTNRGQDTYGTLLACAALMLGPELAAELDVPLGPEEEREWASLLAADALPEIEDAKPNYRQCVDQILTASVKAWRNASFNTLGQVIWGLRTTDDDGAAIEPEIDRATAKRHVNVAGFGLLNTHELVAGVMRAQGIGLNEALMRYGLPAAGWVLAVPNKSTKVAEHLEGSDWQHGAWKDALRQCPVPGVMITNADINKVTIDGAQQRCTLIVLDKYHAAPER
ncbi:hypothetical protein IP86_03050 [Rhodopseudomonas sp. AAP120]|uniref:hypothetical protein n=1 Tax=Rhodopseudomonas sp. AAP120 TaxID=1523430 RepID=UPI0006B923CF|nr:hypothetical protein [Rhodopseudomonas sp. AAP120]KPG01801.1 hypothetical protein IP86_03050 [Rhodopseudomonas sp. AAP120]